MTLLDFIRYSRHLAGTKIGCREGDCGACTVLIGEWKENRIVYRPATSCLTPLGNIHHKHVVTIEGLNMEGLSPVQQAMCDEGGTQCGFCTPGFVVSMTAFCLSEEESSYNKAQAAVDGNICRCTGYKSIQRALQGVSNTMKEKNEGEDSISFAIAHKLVPEYFSSVHSRLAEMILPHNGILQEVHANAKFTGGGTDLYVQQHEAMVHSDINFLFDKPGMKQVLLEEDRCVIGAAATVTDLLESPVIKEIFPRFQAFAKLVSSTPIRNIATLAGNFANASPIGDFSIFFLALNTTLVLNNNGKRRELPLRQFYKGYKKLDKEPNEFIEKFWFVIDRQSLFNFEKVSKRTNLDIASVNTAINISVDDGKVLHGSLSAGGVAPVPLFLSKSSAWMEGKKLDEEFVHLLIEKVHEEISPISDVRGTADYKRLLLSQLVKAHFIELFPQLTVEKLLLRTS